MLHLDTAPSGSGVTTFADVANGLQIGDEVDWVPNRLVDSAWLEHAPFAFWIVKTVRPKTLIELGTFSGYSYSAFCQAVQYFGLPTRCFAIDTWKGDAHTAYYPEYVFEEFSEYHNTHLNSFSSLIRAEFDSARPYFADNSVDLLHIDGFHSYEQARLDFETWKAALSDSGVVLFHDVNVRERNFGVWRVWHELSQTYPSFEFLHGHGLGVLGVGKDQSPHMRELYALAQNESATALVRYIFSRRGEAIRLRYAAAQVKSIRQELHRATAARDNLASSLEQARTDGVHLTATLDITTSKLQQAQEEAAQLRAALQRAETSERAIRDSTSWKVTAPIRRILSENILLRKVLRRAAKVVYWTFTLQLGRRLREYKAVKSSQVHARQGATTWLPSEYPETFNTLHRTQKETLEELKETAVSLEDLSYRPLISVVIPTYNTKADLLRSCLDSVIAQTYPFWELCIADDASSNPCVRQILEEYAAKDKRFRIVFRDTNGHISVATNSALALCTGEFVAFVDHDDLLIPNALWKCVKAINEVRDTDVVYTDLAIEAVDRGSRVDFRKPDWSPTFFRGVMYIGHLLIVRRSLVEELHGFDSQYDGVQDYEFMLRVSEKTQKIRHVPEILYIWRAAPGSIAAGTENKPVAGERQLLAVTAHLKRVGVKASVIAHPSLPHRAILVPNKDARTPASTLVVEIANRERGERVLSALRTVPPGAEAELLLIGPPNEASRYTAVAGFDTRVITAEVMTAAPLALNRAAHEAQGELLVFVADGWGPTTKAWIRELAFYFEDDEVGLVAPLLLNQDGTIFAAGLRVSSHGTVERLFQGHSPDEDGYFGALAATREVSAVPRACFVVRKRDFEAIGGFSRYIPRAFRSADLCLSLARRGLRTLIDPHCRFRFTDLRQTEVLDPLEALTFKDKWKDDVAAGDRFWRN